MELWNQAVVAYEEAGRRLVDWRNWVRARPWRPIRDVTLFTLAFAVIGLAFLLVVVALGYTRDGPYLDWNAVTAAAPTVRPTRGPT